MPINKSALIRYRVINKCLTDTLRKFPTRQYLAQKCSEVLGDTISPSCIEKDIRAMRESAPKGYDAPIEYNHFHKGYHYSEAGFSIDELNLADEEWQSLRYAAAMLHQYKEVPIFTHFKSAIERINSRFDLGIEPDDPGIEKFVQYEQGHTTAGYRWLKEIYGAIEKRYKLFFEYENVYKQEIKSYELIPCMLKEMRNNWYVIGWSEERNRYLTFATDRLISLREISVKQKRRTDFDPEKHLRNTVGIMETDNGPDTVVMTIRAPFDRLAELEPLHHSQDILKKSKNAVQIRLHVDINPELCLRILSLGPACTVQKPQKLVNDLVNMITEMRKNYN